MEAAGQPPTPSKRCAQALLGLLRAALSSLIGLAKLALVAYFCLWAYRIRLHAINEYGYLIHEFDPWFNFRATQYLAKHGWLAFSQWYDYMSWYPVGRPIGTTTYPGMQIASVAIWRALKSVPKWKYEVPREVLAYVPKGALEYLPGNGRLRLGPMILNDVCCMVPAWFGSLATLFLALLTVEVSGSTGAGVAAAFVMAIIPAHLMRSVAGGFDNEAVAVTTFCATFWLWCRAVRTPGAWPFGAAAGVAYACAAATWGGYIFVNNLIGLHAATLVAVGKYNYGIYRAYSLWYVIGTFGATFVPVIRWTPLRSMEQLPSLLVFLGFQLLELCDHLRRRRRGGMSGLQFFLFRACVFALVGAVLLVVGWILLQLNYFAPWTSRIRGLFLKHEKTGNPLVDSVAEHQPSTSAAYHQYLHNARFAAAAGLLFCWHQRSPAKLFPVLYAAVAYHFSLKMSRLMIICGPIVSMLAGLPAGVVVDWCLEQFVALPCGRRPPPPEEPPPPPRSGGMGSILRGLQWLLRRLVCTREVRDLAAGREALERQLPLLDRLLRAAAAAAVLAAAWKHGRGPVRSFVRHCEERAPGMSHPSIVWKSGGTLVDDYLVGYKWLKANTPGDARVMAWWDYGYQITGIGNRTSIADGNTWNHEHIATLGRTLTNPEKKAHNIMRHLTDYVLVWAGGGADDMGKSPHLARIANSVFPDVCGEDDPTCQKFGFYAGGEPTLMMAASFLYRAVNHQKQKGVHLSPSLFREVHTTKHGLMRIFEVLNVSQESKAWVADPANRVCDAPGSWYCVGQYPPALGRLIAARRNFAQLEDFNKAGQEKSAYTRMVERSSRTGKKQGGEL